MASTLTAELALLGHEALLLIELEGAGRRSGHDTAGATTSPYAFTTVAVAGDSAGTLVTDRLIPCLTRLPRVLSERLNTDTCECDIGQYQLGLRHSAVPSSTLAAQGWDSLLDLFAWKKAGSSWQLEAAVSAADADCHYVPAATDPTEHSILWLGAEAVRVDAVDTVNHIISWTRGVLGTTAAPHDVWPVGDGYLHDRPRYWRGREVTIKLLLRDHSVSPDPTTGRWYAVPEAQAEVLWSGVLQDAEIPREKPGELLLLCRGALARLNRALGRRQWEGQVYGFQQIASANSLADFAETTSDEVRAGVSLHVDVPPEDRQRVPDRPETQDPGLLAYYRDLHCRIGDQLSEVRVWQTDVSHGDTAPISSVKVRAWRCCGTDDPSLVDIEEFEARRTIREVLPVSARPRRSYAVGETPMVSFQCGGDPTEHPLDVLLALATSTGSMGGTNGSWDYTPRPWGLAIPYTEFDLHSFRTLKNEQEAINVRNLILGWDGRPVRLARWWAETCGRPFGWVLHMSRAGLFKVTRLRDCYPRETVWTIGPEHLVQGSISTSANWDATVSTQVIRHGATPDGEFQHTRRICPPEAVERLQDDDSEIVIDAPGVPSQDTAGEDALSLRSQQLARRASPLPTLGLALSLRYFNQVELGDLVEVDGVTWPDPAYGTRTLNGVLAMVTEVGLEVETASARLTLEQVEASKGAYHTACARVDSYNAGTLTVTTTEYDFVDDLESGVTAATDPESFDVDDPIALYDAEGVPRCDTAGCTTVHSRSGALIVLEGKFKVGGVQVDPVKNDIIAPPRYETGDSPAKTWTERQKDCVALADETAVPPQIGTSGDEPYVYGG